MMTERRKLVRFKVPFYLKYGPNDPSRAFPGIGKDINMKGIKILLDKSLDITPESLISLYLLFPEKTLKVYGKVAWTKEYEDRKEAGVYFVNIFDIYKQDIFDYIFKYHPQEFTRRWWQM